MEIHGKTTSASIQAMEVLIQQNIAWWENQILKGDCEEDVEWKERKISQLQMEWSVWKRQLLLDNNEDNLFQIQWSKR